jgi:hypothetical protein
MEDLWGLFLTKPNKDIKSEGLSLKDFDFRSDYPLLKLAKSGSGIEPYAVEEEFMEVSIEISVEHNLGYKPRVFVFGSIQGGFFNDDINAYLRVPYSATSSSQGFWDTITYDLDNDSLTINFSGSGWSTTGNVGYVYYICYEEE